MKELKLDVDKEQASGRYANLAVITHTATEFFLDFALAHPRQAPMVVSRVITSPQHAKALLLSLQENLRRYEARFGQIPAPAPGKSEEHN